MIKAKQMFKFRKEHSIDDRFKNKLSEVSRRLHKQQHVLDLLVERMRRWRKRRTLPTKREITIWTRSRISPTMKIVPPTLTTPPSSLSQPAQLKRG